MCRQPVHFGCTPWAFSVPGSALTRQTGPFCVPAPPATARSTGTIRLQRFLARVALRPPIRKQFRRSLNRLPLPVRLLAGMHPVIGSDFLNGLLFLDRLQRDSCFHIRAAALPLPRFHLCSLSETAILHLVDWSEFWGALHPSSTSSTDKTV